MATLLLAQALVSIAASDDRSSVLPEDKPAGSGVPHAQDVTPTDPNASPPPTAAGVGPRLGPAADEARRAALEGALDWLAKSQAESADGSWPDDDARLRAPEAVAALCSLALMAGGSTPERGPHGAAVARGTDYLLGRIHLDPGADERGFIGSLEASDSRMHGHGLATLALAEAFSTSPTSRRGQRLLEALQLAVGLIERTQGAEGGWWYEPHRVASHEGSVTITLVQALRSARNTGIAVDAGVITRAEDYVLRSQAPDGSFRYTLGSPVTTVALTGAAISTLNAAGRYDDEVVRRGVDAIWRGLESRELEGSSERPPHPYYERFYLSQAFWNLADPTHFEKWYERELERVLSRQADDGSWSGEEQGSGYGAAYATSINALFLALPDGLLPIFQR
ncbi:prenyltransferase/squalene oxidase repeat-containing protein [Engelhardtia mirabilis]|uniref:prenyltransferase/squalene oxidase repeat-containing protein n=1 Tax=Engelhardtia mirabilis TaxID=2528011 RepID=UPI00119FE56C